MSANTMMMVEMIWKVSSAEPMYKQVETMMRVDKVADRMRNMKGRENSMQMKKKLSESNCI